MMVNDIQKDAIKELVNIAVGRAAGMLNTLIEKHLTLYVPESKLIYAADIGSEIHYLKKETLSAVSMSFKNGITGTSKLILPWTDAEKLVNLFTHENLINDNFEEVRSAILSEVGNIVLNSLMGTISNLVNSNFTYQVPIYSEGWYDKIFEFDNVDNNSIVLIAQTQFLIDDLKILGDLMIFLQLENIDNFIQKIDYFAEKFGN